MEKIPTLFVRDPDNMSRATEEVTPGCEWVLAGEGVATEKLDGTCCLIKDGEFYKRHRLKEGKPMPTGWLHWSFDPEQKSGHGWLPVVAGQPENQHHMEAFIDSWADGTYELVGPKVQRNPYGYSHHHLKRHGVNEVHEEDGLERTFDGIREWLQDVCVEGIVFHHPDGRMAKIKRRDFGFQWPAKGRA